MIQLQHIDKTGTNLGGLYVRPDEIAAIYAVCKAGEEPETNIVLKSGRGFRTAQSVSELLEIVTAKRGKHGEQS